MLLGDPIYNTLNGTNYKTTKKLDVTTYSRPKTAIDKQNKETRIYTHIFIDPKTIIKQHLKDRVLTNKQNKNYEEEVLNLTRNTNTNKMNKSSLSLSKLNNTTGININKNDK
jgi:hypothetical protein